MRKNILHICYLDKFIPDFVELVRTQVKTNNHYFITMGSNYDKYPIKDGKDLSYLSGRYLRYIKIAKEMNLVDRVMLHGLFDPGIIILLFMQPWLLKKCYWVMWGGDIYDDQEKGLFASLLELVKRKVAKNMGYLVTYIPGDVEHVRKKYGAKGEHKNCIMYLSNCYKDIDFDREPSDTLNIQIGNSADQTNEHFRILKLLKESLDGDFKVFAPLSYGDFTYAKKVEQKGVDYFGEQFIPMFDFMSLAEYTRWQCSIDIAIFAHKRQQGMGNIITLLGLGSTVYMRSDVSSSTALENMGIKLGKIESDNITVLPSSIIANNVAIIKSKFSVKALTKQLTELFD